MSSSVGHADEAATPLAQNGKTALMEAARDRDVDRVRELLGSGADPNQVNRNGGTVLMYSALGGDPAVVKLVLAREVDVNATAKNGWSALMIAAAKGYVEIVGLLLEAGADPNLTDVYRWTPLMRAAYENRDRIVAVLLKDARTSVDQRGENGVTALHLAATQGHVGVARTLLAHGADPSLRDGSGRTPYAIAEVTRRSDLMQLLQP